jgi:adenosylcobinamide kinase/adenosylcobinamide-phosphate guanylyltransferase
VLVEDLTLLLTNHLLAPDGYEASAVPHTAQAEGEVIQEIDNLFRLSTHVVLVSNEVGLGLVPDNPLGRRFRDALGRVNQHAAEAADDVYLLVAGLPLRLKPVSSPPFQPATLGIADG